MRWCSSYRNKLIGCTAGALTAMAAPMTVASEAPPPAWNPPVYGPIYGVLLGCLLAIAAIRGALSKSNGSLADALSEDVQLTARDDKGNILFDKDGKPLIVTQLCASTSRLIALMGMVVIMVMYLGFGVFVLYEFGATGNLPGSVPTVINFFLSGTSLFAPYLVNKFMGVFEGISGK